MKTTSSLRLEDRQLIMDQIYTYCWGQDHDDLDMVMSIFTDDLHFEFGDAKIDGRENFSKQWITKYVIGTLLHMRHIVTNTVIEFEGEEKAKSKSYWSFNSGHKEHEKEGVTERGEGKYYLKWRKENGEWKAYELIAPAVWWTGYSWWKK